MEPERRALRAGDCIRVGRQEPCEVVVLGSPSVSKLHCYVEAERVAGESGETLKCFVKDVSANGTWVGRGDKASGRLCVAQTGVTTNAVRLERGKREELRIQDTLFLLSPRHPDCQQCCLQLKEGAGGQVFLCQLSAIASEPSVTADCSNVLEGGVRGEAIKPSDGSLRVWCGEKEDEDRFYREEVASKRLKLDCEADAIAATHTTAGATDSPGTTSGPDSVRQLGTTGSSNTVREGTNGTLRESIAGSCDAVREGTRENLMPAADVGGAQMQSCPICQKLFPSQDLIPHSSECQAFDSPPSSGVNSGTEEVETASDLPSEPNPPPHPLSRHVSVEHCPKCMKLFPVLDLVTHWESCIVTPASAASCSMPAVSTAGERTVYTLEACEPPVVGETGNLDVEQCPFCLKDVLMSEVVPHSYSCPMREKGKNTVEEHCQHCLKIFPLDELISHSLSCSSRAEDTSDVAAGAEGSAAASSSAAAVMAVVRSEEPLERCMHCFRDFPLCELVAHASRCTGDMLGSRDRFKEFLPSVHDLDPMALSVLNETQARAVEYVMQQSKSHSERIYSSLKAKVERLGYTEKDLERVLLWVRHEAPIIIHVKLDTVLHYLVKDTHYRNQFETHTSGGCTDLRIRSSWEDRIFNKIYASSLPVDRVKYGVLNIVGDPRGVKSCYSYGDSFLQLKKVRLRTTFASADTSCGSVKLSCCEHYGNVLVEYSDNELRAILEVATRKKSFLHSRVISVYKEVQIHGPVCLSENVECVVANNRHRGNAAITTMLDEFVKRNSCNLIWMDPEAAAESAYPSLTPLSAIGGHAGRGSHPVPYADPSMLGGAGYGTVMEHRRERVRAKRRRKRRRRRRRRRSEYDDDYLEEPSDSDNYYY